MSFFVSSLVSGDEIERVGFAFELVKGERADLIRVVQQAILEVAGWLAHTHT